MAAISALALTTRSSGSSMAGSAPASRSPAVCTAGQAGPTAHRAAGAAAAVLDAPADEEDGLAGRGVVQAARLLHRDQLARSAEEAAQAARVHEGRGAHRDEQRQRRADQPGERAGDDLPARA